MRTYDSGNLPLGLQDGKPILLCVKKYLLLVFSVTPFKIDQNKNQNRSIGKVQNLGNKKKVNKQRPRSRFRPEEFFVYEISEEMFGAHLDGHQHGRRKLTETSVTEFC